MKADGTIANRRTFFDAKPYVDPKFPGLCDGIKADKEGNIWTGALGGVAVISPAGKLIGRIYTGEQTSNCNWGDDGSTLYITADYFLLRVKTKTKGGGLANALKPRRRGAGRRTMMQLMRISKSWCLIGLLIASLPGASRAAEPATQPTFLDRTDTLPIAVWLQDPSNAARYKAIGVNLYVALWEGPTAAQLTALEKAGMPVICEQNAEALKPQWKSEIVAFMHEDEPDNAQSLGEGKGYGPPIPPEKVIERFRAMKAADPRPVLLNLGQGVAWDDWYGRGVRTHKPEDYPQYVLGADIVAFDIYPAVHDNPQVAGKLSFVGQGVQRLVKWTDGKKRVWTCIETTHIGNAKVKPTPAQVKAEVWMALIQGARGLIYFSHQFQPKFIEAGLLADAPMSDAVRKINSQVQGSPPRSTPPCRSGRPP